MEQEVEPRRSNRRGLEEQEPYITSYTTLVIHESVSLGYWPYSFGRGSIDTKLAQLLPSYPPKEQQAPSNLIYRVSKPQEAHLGK